MTNNPRVFLAGGVLAILVLGILIATVVIDATSGGGSAPDLTSPSALATATRSLPSRWIVRPGDSYDTIAAQTHLSVSQLQALNPTQDPNTLVPGERLRLHLPGPHHAHARRVIPASWTVRSGDTYSSIAAKVGVPVYEIDTLNPNVNPNLLHPGQKLKLRSAHGSG